MKNLMTITGRLTRDADIKYFESGKVKTTFSIAVDSYINKEKQTSFINCEIWDKKAEFVAEYFKKGKVVTVTGEFRKSTYKDKGYYNLICNNANFTTAQMVVVGDLVPTADNKFEIRNEGTHFEVDFYGKEMPTGYHTVLLNVAMKDYKPILTFIKVIDTIAENELISEDEIPF